MRSEPADVMGCVRRAISGHVVVECSWQWCCAWPRTLVHEWSNGWAQLTLCTTSSSTAIWTQHPAFPKRLAGNQATTIRTAILSQAHSELCSSSRHHASLEIEHIEHHKREWVQGFPLDCRAHKLHAKRTQPSSVDLDCAQLQEYIQGLKEGADDE